MLEKMSIIHTFSTVYPHNQPIIILMVSDLFFDNNKYIKVKKAGLLCGYSKDYVSQLARSGKIQSKMVGQMWYVSESSLLNYKSTPTTFDFSQNLLGKSKPAVSSPECKVEVKTAQFPVLPQRVPEVKKAQWSFQNLLLPLTLAFLLAVGFATKGKLDFQKLTNNLSSQSLALVENSDSRFLDRTAFSLYDDVNTFIDGFFYSPISSLLNNKPKVFVVIPVVKNNKPEVKVVQKSQIVTPTKTVGQTIIQNAISSPPQVTERIIERVSGGVSTSDLDSRLQQLANKFSSDLSLRISSLSSGSATPVTNIYQQIAGSQKIDRLFNTTINTPNIVGGSISGTNVSASSLSATSLNAGLSLFSGNVGIGTTTPLATLSVVDSIVGPELVTNGTFTGNANGWTLGAGWSYAGNKVTHTPGQTAILEQAIPGIIVGHSYTISAEGSGITQGRACWSAGGGGGEFLYDETQTFTFTATNTSNFIVDVTCDGGPDFDGSIDNVTFKETPNSFRVSNNGTDSLSVDAIGNVAIGAASFHKNGGFFFTGVNDFDSSGTFAVSSETAGNAIINIFDNSFSGVDSVPQLWFSMNAGDIGSHTGNNYNGGVAKISAHFKDTADATGFMGSIMNFSFFGNTTPLSILSNGNIGINNTNPTHTLDINGNIRTIGKAGVLRGSIDPTASATVVGVGTFFTTELGIGDRITVSGETRTVIDIASSTSLTVDSAFSNNADDTSVDVLYALNIASLSSGATALVINDLGYLGLSTTTPQATLDIFQTTNGVPIISAYRNTDSAPTGDFINYKTKAGTTLFRVDNSGNLLAGGIVTSGSQTITSISTPQFRLQYDSSNELTFSTTNNGSTTIATNGTNSSLNFLPQNNQVNAFNFQNAAGTSILNIDSVNRRVGLGTTSPYRTLSVVGSAVFTGGDVLASTLTATSSITTPSLTLSAVAVNSLLSTNSSGTITATSTPTFGAFNATSTTATSTISTGGLAVGTNQFVVQQSSGFVGIGTSSPQYILNILSTTASQLALSGGAGLAQWAFRNAGGNFYLGTTTVAGTATTSTSALTIVGATGNIGIGTTTPFSMLSLQGVAPAITIGNTSSVNQSWSLRNGALNAGSTSFDLYDVTNKLTQMMFLSGSDAEVRIGTTTNISGNSSKLFVYGGANGANIDVMGKPSVGADQAVIELEGSDYQTNFDSSALQFNGPNSVGTTMGFSNVNLGILRFQGNSNSLIYTDNTSPLIFATKFAERMRINSTGNVGIGTTTPQWLLNPASSTAPQLALSAGAGLAQWAFRNAGGNLYLATTTVAGTATTTTSALTIIGSTGNIGIGTTTPWAQFSIHPNALGNVPEFVIGSSTKTHLVVDGGGNVGIGTTSPSQLLTVGNNNQFTVATTGAISIGGVANTNGYLNLGGTWSGNTVAIGIREAQTLTPAAGVDAYGFRLSPVFTVAASGTHSLFAALTTSGIAYTTGAGTVTNFVGIDVPTITLDTQVTTGTGLRVAASTGATNNYAATFTGGNVGIGTTTPWGLLSIHPNALGTVPEFVVGSSSATHLIVTGGGNVGIGTTTPGSQLEVAGGDTILRVSGSTIANQSIIRFRTNATNRWDVGVNDAIASSGGTLEFSQSGAAPNMVILSSGNVGVATTSPWRTLSVTGTVGFDGLTATGAGDVFVCLSTKKELTQGATCAASSRNVKHDITNLALSGLDAISQLQPVSFIYNGATDTRYGLIAEDAAAVDSHLALWTPGTTTPAGLDTNAFLSVLVQGVKELNAKVESLASSTASVTDSAGGKTFIGKFVDNMFIRITAWLADATNNIGSVFANAFHAKQEICVDDQCLNKDDVRALLALAHVSATSTPSIDTTPPTITILGNNPATISAGSVYSDLGATVTDTNTDGSTNNNLGLHFSVDGQPVTEVTIDTSPSISSGSSTPSATTTTHTVIYSAVDGAGNWGYATRTVEVVQ